MDEVVIEIDVKGMNPKRVMKAIKEATKKIKKTINVESELPLSDEDIAKIREIIEEQVDEIRN